MIAPLGERCRFRYADIDDQGIVSQGPYGDKTNGVVEITGLAEWTATLCNQPIPGRGNRYIFIYTIIWIRVPYEDGAVVTEQYKRLIGKSCNGLYK